MYPFLKQVADHYYKSADIGRRCFVFPNRRSMVFFRKYLTEAVAEDPGSRPFLAPQMYTVNDFFYKLIGRSAVDKVRLLLVLYESYKSLNPSAEPLDEFVFWGDIMLGDFNDVDKYLVDPKQIFANVADFKQLQDTYTYLTDTQRTAIEGFLSHFKSLSDSPGHDSGDGRKDVKGRFLQLWNLLYPIYADYRKRLEERGMAYEGMVYRGLAERLRSEPVSDVLGTVFSEETSFVFVGLNALNECEKVLLSRMRDASMAEFCWDWSGSMIRDPRNRASFFMSENVREYPQAAQWDKDGVQIPEIHVVKVASSAGQAKRLPDILSKGEDFAIVLPDENLLIPVLNSIPDDIKDINVTMGLPMRGSRVFSMMSDLSNVQMHAVCRQDKWFFYHKHVWGFFSGDLFRKSADAPTMEKVNAVKKEARYYIPVEDLNGTPLLDAVFRPVLKDPKMVSKEQISAFADYQKDVLGTICKALTDDVGLTLELEYAKEYYKCVNILQGIGLEVLPATYVRLLSQLLGSISVPFRGEPLKGLQIMGPLETRALDFRNIVILSANEGIFPRRNVSSSFVPPELRRGFGLPAYEYQDAVWAYYFYRMISRAENVWMMVDTRTEGLCSGEESRYVKQLEYHFGVPLKKYTVQFDDMKMAQPAVLEKTEADVEKIRSSVLSATVLQNYLSCPAKFYYGTVRELKTEDEVVESLDYGMFGTVYHDAMRAIYSSSEDNIVMAACIKDMLAREDDIRLLVKNLIIRELNAVELSGRNLVVADVIVRYVIKTLERDLEQMASSGVASFSILGLELKVEGVIHGQRFKGYIDRLDSFAPCQARVVDYKTGKVLDEDENIDDGNAEAIAGKIFAPDVKNRPKIALQFYIYDMLVSSLPQVQGRTIYNSVYSTSGLFSGPPSVVRMNEKFCNAVTSGLKGVLEEMYDVSVPFRRTEDADVCRYCDFKNICGR